MRRKCWSRLVSTLLVIALVLPVFSGLVIIDTKSEAAKVKLKSPRTTCEGITTWDCVYFGNYYQSNDKTKEPIKWRVLSVQGNSAILMSDKVLDYQPYHNEYENIYWDKCKLRSWLNGIFYSRAFDENERDAIEMTALDDTLTNDKIYLLSAAEACNPSYGFNSNENVESETRCAERTEYCKMLCGDISGRWWLRTPGFRFIASYYQRYVNLKGDCGSTYRFNVNQSMEIRPVLKLDISSPVWKYAGTVSAKGGDVYSDEPSPTSDSDEDDEEFKGKVRSSSLAVTNQQSGSAKGAVIDFFPGDYSVNSTLFPLSISQENDSEKNTTTTRIGIGIGASDYLNKESQWARFKEQCDDFNEFSSKYIENFNKSKKKYTTVQGFMEQPELSVTGYYEETVDKNGKVISNGGNVVCNLKWEGERTRQFITAIGPMYYELKGGIDLEGKAGLTYKHATATSAESVELSDDSGLKFIPYISLEGGYGLAKIATIGAKGSLKIPMQIKPTFTGDLEAEASIHVYVIFLLDAEYKLAKCKLNLWGGDKKSAQRFSNVEEGGELKYLDTSFAKNTSKWNGEIEKEYSDSTKKKSVSLTAMEPSLRPIEANLQEGILPSSLPVITEIDGKKVMVFQRYKKKDDIMNSCKLAYSVCENGTWSEPRDVCADETSDFFADMKVVGNKLALVWQKQKKSLSSKDKSVDKLLQEMGENSEVYYAQFNPDTNEFDEPIVITNNTVADMMPKLCDDSSEPTVTWVRNSNGDLTQETGTNTIYSATVSNRTVSYERKIVESTSDIDNYVSYEKSGKVNVAYVTAENGKNIVKTQNNTEIYSSRENESVQENSSLSSLQYLDETVSFSSEGELILYDVTNEKISRYKPGRKSLGRTVSRVKNGEKEGLVWTDYNDDKKVGTIYASIKTNDGYSEPVVLKKASGKNYCYASPILDSEGNWSIVANQKNVADESHSLVYVEKESGIETELDKARVREDEVDENGNTAVDYYITNTSDNEVDTLMMNLVLEDGTVIKKELQETLQPGESKIGTAYVDLKDIEGKQNISVLVYAKNQKDLSNSSENVIVGLPDVKLKSSVKETEDEAIITATLKNQSRYDAKVKVEAVEGSQNSNVYTSSDVKTLAAQKTDSIILKVPKSKLIYNSAHTANIKVQAKVEGGDYYEDNNIDYISLYRENDTNATISGKVPSASTEKQVVQKKVSKPAKVILNLFKNEKGRKAFVKWKKVKGAKGYEIQYAFNNKFKKKKKKKTSKTQITLKKLSKKKTYFVRVRAYKLDGKKKVYGKWSKIKKVKIKK